LLAHDPYSPFARRRRRSFLPIPTTIYYYKLQSSLSIQNSLLRAMVTFRAVGVFLVVAGSNVATTMAFSSSSATVGNHHGGAAARAVAPRSTAMMSQDIASFRPRSTDGIVSPIAKHGSRSATAGYGGGSSSSSSTRLEATTSSIIHNNNNGIDDRTSRILFEIRTLLRVLLPAILSGLIALLTLPAMCFRVANFVTRTMDHAKIGMLEGTVQSFISLVGLLYSILVGQVFGFLYSQQEVSKSVLYNTGIRFLLSWHVARGGMRTSRRFGWRDLYEENGKGMKIVMKTLRGIALKNVRPLSCGKSSLFVEFESKLFGAKTSVFCVLPRISHLDSSIINT